MKMYKKARHEYYNNVNVLFQFHGYNLPGGLSQGRLLDWTSDGIVK
jgi:hypothetical protein